ncbi:hypothetical protein X943_003961 [Babesia divergens]|uniref:Uncharacterized protein n=1 Tax=Babesia divergens TaxID=32595 RepID=A0AAD9LIR9_BABDI|nr:hypothetical protein X943_003961 [Babesia divergens]
MGGNHYGLFFRSGWFSRNILRTVALFVGADAYICTITLSSSELILCSEYGIDVNYDFNTNAWSWWMDKTPEER